MAPRRPTGSPVRATVVGSCVCLLALTASLAAAQSGFPSQCTAICLAASSAGGCDPKTIKTRLQASTTTSSQNALYNTFLCCSSACTVDQCSQFSDASSCLAVKGCAPVPEQGGLVACIAQSKLCQLTPDNQCAGYRFCSNSSGSCAFDVSSSAPSTDDGPSVADSCPAMHPMVVAMLVLMFLTFVGAVVLVAFVVVRNQRQADEDEKRAETAAAVEAEAERSRRQRHMTA